MTIENYVICSKAWERSTRVHCINSVTLSIYNREVFSLEHPRCASEHCHGEWVAATSNWGRSLCIFLRSFAPVALESSSHATLWSSSRASATSFTLLSSGLRSFSMPNQPSRKLLTQRETVLRSTVNWPQTSLKEPCIFHCY